MSDRKIHSRTVIWAPLTDSNDPNAPYATIVLPLDTTISDEMVQRLIDASRGHLEDTLGVTATIEIHVEGNPS